MAAKIKVLCLSLWYPLTMSRYFERAMLRNPLIDLKTVGPYTGNWIPWLGGISLPEKYAKPPDIPLPFPPHVGRVPFELVTTQLGDWTPDIVLAIDAGINWTAKPHKGIVATVATDPHALDYEHQRKISDKFFNMQRTYSEPKDIYLPYAYDPTVHYIEGNNYVEENGDIRYEQIKDHDAVLIGMPYPNRIQWVDDLRKHGVSVIFENAPVFDEYRALANRARIGLNWSDQRDLNARFFETPAFGLAMVTNRVPDAHEYLQEGVHYLGFDNIGEATEKVLFLKEHPAELTKMARGAREAIAPHTYDVRVSQILKECLESI